MTIVPSAVGGGSIRTNLKEVVADHIRNLIFSGQLRPGHKVDQDEIAGGWSGIAGEQHRRIEAALRVRDGAAAEKAMAQHILSGGEYAVEMLRESGFWNDDAE